MGIDGVEELTDNPEAEGPRETDHEFEARKQAELQAEREERARRLSDGK